MKRKKYMEGTSVYRGAVAPKPPKRQPQQLTMTAPPAMPMSPRGNRRPQEGMPKTSRGSTMGGRSSIRRRRQVRADGGMVHNYSSIFEMENKGS